MGCEGFGTPDWPDGPVAVSLREALKDNRTLSPGKEIVFVLEEKSDPEHDEKATPHVDRKPVINTIGKDAILAVPGMEPVNTLGKTLGEIRDELQARLDRDGKRFYIYVNLFVDKPDISTDLVEIGGYVGFPCRLPWREGITVIEAIRECGGLSEGAYVKHTELKRGGKVQILDLNHEEARNLLLDKSDMLIISACWF